MTNDPAGLFALLASTPIGPYLVYLPALIALCSAAATVLPKPAGGSWLTVPYSAIQFIALNFGRAKNASAVPAVSEAGAAVQAVVAAADKAAAQGGTVTTVTGIPVSSTGSRPVA